MDDYSFQGRKHIKRDYYNKTFSNPYFKKTVKDRSKFNTKLYIQALTAVFLLYLIISCIAETFSYSCFNTLYDSNA